MQKKKVALILNLKNRCDETPKRFDEPRAAIMTPTRVRANGSSSCESRAIRLGSFDRFANRRPLSSTRSLARSRGNSNQMRRLIGDQGARARARTAEYLAIGEARARIVACAHARVGAESHSDDDSDDKQQASEQTSKRAVCLSVARSRLFARARLRASRPNRTVGRAPFD